jgi:hypothetical protein
VEQNTVATSKLTWVSIINVQQGTSHWVIPPAVRAMRGGGSKHRAQFFDKVLLHTSQFYGKAERM